MSSAEDEGTAAVATDDAPTDEAQSDEAPDPAAGGEEETPAEPQLDDLRAELLAVLHDELGDAVVGVHGRAGDDLWVRVTNEAWVDAGRAARDRLGCSYFNFLSAIDWLPSVWGRDEDSAEDNIVQGTSDPDPAAIVQGYAGGDTRWQVFARVVSPTRHVGLTLKADVADDDPRIATWTGLYPGADWHEREAWEMYGITFVGHRHLAHLYLPGEFEGNPLRKDFPLLARQVKPWPGIVDVEPMPEEAASEEDGAPADEAATEPTAGQEALAADETEREEIEGPGGQG